MDRERRAPDLPGTRSNTTIAGHPPVTASGTALSRGISSFCSPCKPSRLRACCVFRRANGDNGRYSFPLARVALCGRSAFDAATTPDGLKRPARGMANLPFHKPPHDHLCHHPLSQRTRQTSEAESPLPGLYHAPKRTPWSPCKKQTRREGKKLFSSRGEAVYERSRRHRRAELRIRKPRIRNPAIHKNARDRRVLGPLYTAAPSTMTFPGSPTSPTISIFAGMNCRITCALVIKCDVTRSTVISDRPEASDMGSTS
jgi:hypothetical protein